MLIVGGGRLPRSTEYAFDQVVICVLGPCPDSVVELLQGAMLPSMRLSREIENVDKAGDFLTVIIGRLTDLEGVAPPSILDRAHRGLQDGGEGFWVEDGNCDGHVRVWIVAERIRGVSYGIGWLIRSFRQTIAGNTGISMPNHHLFQPRYPIRGQHLGYRPISNTYDAWDIKQFEHYIAELSLFGANTIEWVPAHTPGQDTSDLMPRSPDEMLCKVAQFVHNSDLDFSIWVPLTGFDYLNNDAVSQQLEQWEGMLDGCAQVDHFFVPGGDPGSNPPHMVFRVLERFAPLLQQRFPSAKIWISCQGWTRSELDQFIRLANQRPDWLFGVVYGPWTRRPLKWLREVLHQDISIRLYPDITHTFSCQFPVRNWDPAFAATEGREPINPMPTAHAEIARTFLAGTQGFVSYSEGVNDDFNKMLWSLLAFDPAKPVAEVVSEYVRTFISRSEESGWSRLIMDLEANWDGPVTANAGIERTLTHLKLLWQNSSEAIQGNWRVQQLAYRAHYDAWVRSRAMTEGALADCIQEVLMEAGPVPSRIETALQIASVPPPRRSGLYQSLETLGQRLRNSIAMQLSTRYGASEPLRGANLDTAGMPVSHYNFLLQELRGLRDLSDRRREMRLEKVIDWLAGSVDEVVVDFGLGSTSAVLTSGSPDLLEGVGQSMLPSWLVDTESMGDYQVWPYGLEYGIETRDHKMRYRVDGLLVDTAYQLKVFYWGEYRGLVKLWIHGNVAHAPMGISIEPVVVHVPAEWIPDGQMILEWELMTDSAEQLESGIQVAQIRYRPSPQCVDGPN